MMAAFACNEPPQVHELKFKLVLAMVVCRFPGKRSGYILHCRFWTVRFFALFDG